MKKSTELLIRIHLFINLTIVVMVERMNQMSTDRKTTNIFNFIIWIEELNWLETFYTYCFIKCELSLGILRRCDFDETNDRTAVCCESSNTLFSTQTFFFLANSASLLTNDVKWTPICLCDDLRMSRWEERSNILISILT